MYPRTPPLPMTLMKKRKHCTALWMTRQSLWSQLSGLPLGLRLVVPSSSAMTTTSSRSGHATPLMIGPPTKTRLPSGLNQWKEASTIVSSSLSSSQTLGTTRWNSLFSMTTCTGTTIPGTTTLSQAGCSEVCRLHKTLQISDCHCLKNFPFPSLHAYLYKLFQLFFFKAKLVSYFLNCDSALIMHGTK